MIYPKETKFKSSGFNWKLKFINMTSESFGDTDTNNKEVNIYYRGHPHQVITETVIHELLHVVMAELHDSVFQFDGESNYKKEENLISLISPRIFSLIGDNPKLISLISAMIKEC